MKVPGIYMWTAGCLWAVATALGFVILTGYENSWGRAAVAPSTLVASGFVNPGGDRQTLLLFAHPSCPCTMATIEELKQLLARRGSLVRAYALLLSPRTRPANWDDSRMRAELSRIPGMNVINDIDGSHAKRFEVHTSGQVLLYGVDGSLRFSGGITAARNHIGDNDGLAALVEAIDRNIPVKRSPVFGCQLQTLSTD
jgi:hypothetical protein